MNYATKEMNVGGKGTSEQNELDAFSPYFKERKEKQFFFLL